MAAEIDCHDSASSTSSGFRMSELRSHPLFRLQPSLQKSGKGIVLRYPRWFRAMPFVGLAVAVLNIALSALFWPNIIRREVNESLLLILLSLVIGRLTLRLSSVIIDRQARLMTTRS